MSRVPLILDARLRSDLLRRTWNVPEETQQLG